MGLKDIPDFSQRLLPEIPEVQKFFLGLANKLGKALDIGFLKAVRTAHGKLKLGDR